MIRRREQRKRAKLRPRQKQIPFLASGWLTKEMALSIQKDLAFVSFFNRNYGRRSTVAHQPKRD